MRHGRDVEAQRDVSHPHRASYHFARYYPLGWLTVFGKELGEDEIYEMKDRRPEVASDVQGDVSSAHADLAQPVVPESQATGATFIFPCPRARPRKCDILY